MAPRTGKTKTFIDYCSILHQLGRVNRVLIFAPVSVMGVWENEITAHCPFPHRIVVWDKKARKKGGGLPRYGDMVLDWVIINYDALSVPGKVILDKEGNPKGRSKKRGGRFDTLKVLKAWQPQVIGLDESHRIKSPTAVKSRMIHRLGPVAEYRVVMTGTVVTKKKRVFDIWSQWKFLMPDRFPMTAGEFKSYYGVWRQRPGYELWIRNINQKELHRKLHQDAFAITREECFDLPPRTHQIVPVDLEESGPIYDQMAEDMVARIHTGEITEASIKLVQGLKLRQITSGIVRLEATEEHPKGKLVRTGQEKLNALKEILSDLFEADEKVVIGAHFVGDINSIRKLCEDLGVDAFVLRGGVPRRQRDADIENFRKHEGPACFIAQPQAASLGIDLRTASILIWFSLTPSYVDFTQFNDRIALSERATTYMYLLARDTIDEIMYKTLQEDGDVVKEIMASPESLLRGHH